MSVLLPRAVLDDVIAHARSGVPEEVCGLFAGRRSGERREVLRHWRVRNAHPRPVGEYLLDPREQLRITLEVEDDLGLEVVGFYHSHPIGPPRLSTTDAARATYPGALYFLVWLEPTEGYGAWTWDADRNRFLPEELTLLDAAPAPPGADRLALLRGKGAFLLDAVHQRVHRAEALTAACAAEIDPDRVQVAADVLKASLALKTRHYLPCPRCWGG